MKSQSISPRTGGALTGVVGFLVVMELGSGMLQGWYPVLLPSIGTEFSVTSAALNWVSVMYMLATVVCVPIIAKLGDMFGHKRLLVVAASLVAIGSIVVAIAPTFEVLLVGRALQAPLAAFLPLEFAIVRDRDEKSSGRSVGKLVGALTLGATLGALGSGIVFSLIGDLRVVLWFPAIFLLICVPVVIFLVPESKARIAGRIDWLGASLLGIGLLLVLAGISNGNLWGWADIKTLASIIGGLVLLVAWVQVEKRVSHPLINLDLLLHGGIGLPVIMAFLFGAQLFGSSTATSVFALSDPAVFGFGLGLTPAIMGIIAIFPALSAFLTAVQADRISKWIGVKPALIIGGVLIALSYLLLIFVHDSAPLFALWMAVGGLGNGLVIGILPAIVVRKAPADSVGIASAIYNTSRTAAGAVAGAVFALVMSMFVVSVTVDGTDRVVSSGSAYIAVWAISAVISLAVAVLALFLTDAGAPPEDRTVSSEPAQADQIGENA